MSKGRKFLSDLKLYSDYLGYVDDKGRYETWEEAVEDVVNTHKVKYNYCIDELQPYLDYATEAYKEKLFLASQRNLQFRGDDIFRHNFRLYNCTTLYCDKTSFFGNAFYMLLCGCGVGANFMLPFIDRLPHLKERTNGTITYVIEDSIEGWAEAMHVLISSFVIDNSVFDEYTGYKIKFDYSLIRPKGAKVGRRFKAPGPDGLKNSLEKIELLLEQYVTDYPKPFKSIIAYDIFMHLADAVLSGGVRRSACSIIVSPEDTDLIYAKSGNWRQENSQRSRSNNSVGLLRGKFSKEDFLKLLEINNGTSDIGFVFLNNIFEIKNPCVVGSTKILTNKGFIEIKKLTEIYKDDLEIKIITQNKDNELFSSTLKWCGVTHENDGIFKVTFSNSKFQLVNSSHKFYLGDFSQIEVKDIKSKLEKDEIVYVKGYKDMIKVQNILDLNYSETVYDLTANPNYNFFALYDIDETFSNNKIYINNKGFYPYDLIETTDGKKFIKDLKLNDEIIGEF